MPRRRRLGQRRRLPPFAQPGYAAVTCRLAHTRPAAAAAVTAPPRHGVCVCEMAGGWDRDLMAVARVVGTGAAGQRQRGAAYQLAFRPGERCDGGG